MAEIFRCVAGSRLFGTSVATSDTDYKAIHVPSTRDILLQTANKVLDSETNTGRNTVADVDQLSFPLQKYLSLLAKMETNAIEMLFAPNLIESWVWKRIFYNRHSLLSANKKAFTGFGKQQAFRYAVRGDRLESLTRVCDFFAALPKQNKKVSEYYLKPLSDIPHVIFLTGLDGVPAMSVFGRQISLTIKVFEALLVYQKPIKEAGSRTFDAMENGGADWKGLYHAHRVIDEGIEIFSTGELVFPNKNAAHYIGIRTQQFSLEQVISEFEEKLAHLENLNPCSALRERADMEWIDNFVHDTYTDKVIQVWIDDNFVRDIYRKRIIQGV